MNLRSVNDVTQFRRITINDYPINRNDFISNAVSRTKYTFFTFLPLFLFEQFHNYSNCFFLLVTIIQQFPEASFLGRYTTLMPLGVILTVSAIKEILEDLRRSRSDRLINRKTVHVLRDLKWTQTPWMNIQVGDLVRVDIDEFFPADLLLVKSSNIDGICYIETLSLDGENNLKIREMVPGIKVDPLTSFRAIVKCDQPNEFIYEFKGVLTWNSIRIPISSNHLLLRGAVLRNTSWIVGAVIYTGYDTKIIRNSSVTRLKRSSISVMINTQIIVIFGLFVVLTFTHWILFLLWNNQNYPFIWYIPIGRIDWISQNSIILCLVFGVLYSILIPISLTVMLEMSRIVQAVFINNDLDMYYEKADVPAQVKTSALNEDLGLVKYIFADKTGTLTKNLLEFKYCFIGDVVYTIATLSKHISNDLAKDSMLWHFMVALTVCPGVIPVRKDKGISYFASSPDQKSLIMGAHLAGVTLVQRSHNEARLMMGGTIIKYAVLCDFEFSSERKRTSTLVRSPSNELIMYVIGSDDMILPRSLGTDKQYLNIVQKQMDIFAAEGLRSLCIAMVRINEQEFAQWYPRYQKAHHALQNKEWLIAQAESAISRDLVLLGCTAVEDKLQDGVPETIQTLTTAGINVWMLTGDKQDTAINIAKACRLVTSAMPLIVLNEETLYELRRVIVFHKQNLGNKFGSPGNEVGLVVTGHSLKLLFDSVDDVDDFISLMLSCKAVVCCRTTPRQKALIVDNVQKRSRYVTLAVGDGANDVAMIQAASIGVGISGLEGTQAANASDYAIGQFRYLQKLLLVHGTWSYHRICKIIYFIYYKNVALVMFQFMYTSTTAWSGQLYVERWARMMYNVFFTSLPTLAIGIFEQNLPATQLLQMPQIYRKNTWFGLTLFLGCLGNAFMHACIVTWLPNFVFSKNTMWSNGRCDDYLMIGNIAYTSLLAVVCLKSMLHTYYWTNVSVLFLMVSLFIWPVVLFILSHLWPFVYVGEDMPRQFEILITSPLVFFYLLFVIVTTLCIDYGILTAISKFKEPRRTVYEVRAIMGHKT